jgi:hypothetical protein
MASAKKELILAAAVVVCASTSDAGLAALIDRGGGFIYDDVLDVTWLQDANLAHIQRFGLPSKGPGDGTHAFGITGDGSMNFDTASHWLVAMNAASYLGYSDWRLPTTLEPDLSCSAQGTRSSGFNCTGSEMGSLYYVSLGNPFAVIDPVPLRLIPNPDPFKTCKLIYTGRQRGMNLTPRITSSPSLTVSRGTIKDRM